MQIIIQRLGRGLIRFGLVAAKTKPLSRKSLGSVEKTIIPRRIDRCPECDSEKIVFPEAEAGTARTDLGESIGAVPTVAALGSRAAAWWWSRETGSNPEPSDLYVWPL